MTGAVTGIFITAEAGTPVRSVVEANAVAGHGLDGDRYWDGVGFYSATPTTPGARELTLIEEERLDEVARDGFPLGPGEHRRNVTTRGVALDRLLGRQFRIGGVLCEGVRDCPPCNHLDAVTGRALLAPLIHRGGLRARIVTGGVIRVGDGITLVDVSGD